MGQVYSLRVLEADGSPDVRAVRTLTLPNGSVTDDGSGAITISMAVPGQVNTFVTGQVFSGTTVFRQTGGVAGTDELQVSHDGTDMSYDNRQSGGKHVYKVAGVARMTVDTAYLEVDNDAAVRWLGRCQLTSPADRIFRVRGSGSTSAADVILFPNTPAQITADQNNYSPGSGVHQRWSSDASRSVTGMVPPDGNGEGREIWNVGAQDIVLVNESASSTAANRWHTATGADLTLAANKCALARYDGTSQRWRVTLLP